MFVYAAWERSLASISSCPLRLLPLCTLCMLAAWWLTAAPCFWPRFLLSGLCFLPGKPEAGLLWVCFFFLPLASSVQPKCSTWVRKPEFRQTSGTEDWNYHPSTLLFNLNWAAPVPLACRGAEHAPLQASTTARVWAAAYRPSYCLNSLEMRWRDSREPLLKCVCLYGPNWSARPPSNCVCICFASKPVILCNCLKATAFAWEHGDSVCFLSLQWFHPRL